MIKPLVTVFLPPHPSQNVSFPHTHPQRAQHSRLRRGCTQGRRSQTHSEGLVSSPTWPERGGPSRVARRRETQASSYLCSFRAALVVAGFSLRLPRMSLGEALPDLDLWVLTDYSCPV